MPPKFRVLLLVSLPVSSKPASIAHLLCPGGGAFRDERRLEACFESPRPLAVENPYSPRKYLGQMYFDSLVHDPAVLEYLIRLAGVDRVMLGSDYPFPLGEDRPGTLIESLDLDEASKASLLHATALEWLGMAKGAFGRTLTATPATDH